VVTRSSTPDCSAPVPQSSDSRALTRTAVALENGAHHTVNVRDKEAEHVRNELENLTGRRTVDGVLDCAGFAESLGLATAILGT
jgi:propanol-preferring alcohol dehydrogenase